MRASRFAAVFAVVAASLAPLSAAAVDPVNQSVQGVAVEGTDVVAYFQEGAPREGRSEFEHEWNGATWRFASQAHRDAFAADPERFAPQYGGYCAYAVAKGSTASIDPQAWTIVGDELYLNYSKSIQARWEQDIAGYVAKADVNWPGIRDGR